jgi:hypothetical protein
MAVRGKRRRRQVPDEAGAETMEMAVEEVRRGGRTAEGYETVVLATSRGDVETRYYAASGGAAATAGAVFVGGAGGGFDTPVRGWLYPRLSEQLSRDDAIACLRVRYRHPNDLAESTLDVMAGVAFLESEGVEHIALVGHSFGGAVVIQAAAASPSVRTCVPMSTQTYGVDSAPDLSPRCSILLAHGKADDVLPHRCSEYVYGIAREPKKLLLKEGARHGLDEWSDELPGILRAWIRTELTRVRGEKTRKSAL